MLTIAILIYAAAMTMANMSVAAFGPAIVAKVAGGAVWAWVLVRTAQRVAA